MSKTIKNLTKQAQKAYEEKQYEYALHTADRLEAKLKEDNNTDEWLWAPVYNIRLSIYEATGRQDEVLNIAQEVAKAMNSAYYIQVTPLRRKTYFLLAEDALKHATDATTVQQAVEHIDDCINAVSTSEDDNVVFPYYEAQAAIYLRAMQLDEVFRKKERYKLMKILAQIEQNNVAVQNITVAEALQSEQYIKYKKGEPLLDGQQATVVETWQESLRRFEKVIKEIGLYTREYNGEIFENIQVYYNTKETIEDVEQFEKRQNIPLPEALKEMYTQYGAPFICEKLGRYFFDLLPIKYLTKNSDNSSSKSPEDFIGLGTMISMLGEGGESYLKEDLEPETYASLNAQYKVFGYYFVNDCDRVFCFFDKNGNFGTQTFLHDYYDSWWPELYKENKATLSLDKLISTWVDDAIASLIDISTD